MLYRPPGFHTSVKHRQTAGVLVRDAIAYSFIVLGLFYARSKSCVENELPDCCEFH
jgi:hypothetical protein